MKKLFYNKPNQFLLAINYIYDGTFTKNDIYKLTTLSYAVLQQYLFEFVEKGLLSCVEAHEKVYSKTDKYIKMERAYKELVEMLD